MSPREEQAYLRGQRNTAWKAIRLMAQEIRVLGECLEDDLGSEGARALIVLSEVEFLTQQLCRRLGVPLEDGLHPADQLRWCEDKLEEMGIR